MSDVVIKGIAGLVGIGGGLVGGYVMSGREVASTRPQDRPSKVRSRDIAAAAFGLMGTALAGTLLLKGSHPAGGALGAAIVTGSAVYAIRGHAQLDSPLPADRLTPEERQQLDNLAQQNNKQNYDLYEEKWGTKAGSPKAP